MDDAVSTQRASGLPRLLASFNAPGFRLFFANNTFSAVDMNVRIAVHGWLVLELSDDSEFWVGIFALSLGMGQVLFSMVAGAIVDRFQRRNLLLIEGVVSATVAGGIATAVYLDVATLWMAVAIAFPMGCQRALRFTAANRMVYDIVGPRQLVNGASLWRLSATPMMILGALLAGALIDWTGLWAAYAFLAVSVGVGLPFLALVRVKGDVSQSDAGLLGQTLEGVGLLRRQGPLRTLFSISIVMETFGFAFLIMIPVMAKNVLEVGGTGLGFLQAGVGVGMLTASLVMARRGDAQHKPRVVFLAALGAGVALAGFSLSRSLPLSVLLAGATMGFLNAYDLTLGALLQLVSPPALRGRAVSLHSLAISFTALGGFIMGVAGGVVGVPVVLTVSGSAIV
ncbi:MAG: MFS transporter, partial [Dehalococcoidia bacterium]